jgi:predicted RNase H-like HicB family nuclease
MRQYTIFLHPEVDDGGYSVEVPALPGCRTQGETLEEAIANAKEAIAAWIASAEAHGEPIPEETTRPQAIVVDVAA